MGSERIEVLAWYALLLKAWKHYQGERLEFLMLLSVSLTSALRIVKEWVAKRGLVWGLLRRGAVHGGSVVGFVGREPNS